MRTFSHPFHLSPLAILVTVVTSGCSDAEDLTDRRQTVEGANCFAIAEGFDPRLGEFHKELVAIDLQHETMTKLDDLSMWHDASLATSDGKLLTCYDTRLLIYDLIEGSFEEATYDHPTPFGAICSGITGDGHTIWVRDAKDLGQILQFDGVEALRNGVVTRKLPEPDEALVLRLGVGEGRLLGAWFIGSSIYSIDLDDGSSTEVPLGGVETNIDGLAELNGSILVASAGGNATTPGLQRFALDGTHEGTLFEGLRLQGLSCKGP